MLQAFWSYFSLDLVKERKITRKMEEMAQKRWKQLMGVNSELCFNKTSKEQFQFVCGTFLKLELLLVLIYLITTVNDFFLLYFFGT